MKLCRIRSLCLIGLLFAVSASHASMVVTPWIPIFKGIERAAGTNSGSTTFTNNGIIYTDSTLQAANCFRIDLSDPDVQLFASPRAASYVPDSSETSSRGISNFVLQTGVKVATVANFYNSSQGSDPVTEGVPCNIYGLLMTTGQVVSAADSTRYVSILFTTNKTPSIALANTPPGTNTAGIYTAVTGSYPILTNGVIANASVLASAYPDPTIHQAQPRTIHGLSADRRYLYMMIIDGRQNGYSDGSTDNESAIWALVFGMNDAINMDGGGSTAMYMADCVGTPKPLGHSSLVDLRGHERYTGAHLGVMALPLPAFVNTVVATPGSTTAAITWNTDSNATSQVEYGLTSNFGTLSPLDSTLVTNHSVTLNSLTPGTKYFFRVLSVAGGTQYSSSCGASSFITTNIGVTFVFGLTNTWRYQTNNFDGTNWQATAFNDGGWSNGPAPMWADSRNPVPANSTNVIPNLATGTRMPINVASTYPFSTYYLRTRFVLVGSPSGVTLTFSNFVDDGAVFYLNGSEIYRLNVSAGTVTNGTYTPAGAPCGDGNASCPLLFTVSGTVLSNLVTGTNLLAVEVHNFRSLSSGIPSPDVTFESAFYITQPPPPPEIISNVAAAPGETNVTITWTTTSNATTQVQYGLTPALGSSNTLDATLVTSHVVSLSGLQPLTTYYFRVLSSANGSSFFMDGTFATTMFFVPVLTESNSWKYTTNNLAGTNWMAPTYDDSAWLGQGLALLYIEDNQAVSPRNTALPGNTNGLPFPTYYFRTHFSLSNSLAGLALVFTNFIDDGAVFYLNGTEIQRVRMSTSPVTYTTLASGCPINNCETTLDVPDVFRLSGDALTNIVLGGDNVLAAEVHQFTTNDTDIVFGATAGLVRALVTETSLRINRSTNVVCISWSGDSFTLQRASILGGTNAWSDVPGPIKSGPYCTTNPPTTTFYRLRN